MRNDFFPSTTTKSNGHLADFVALKEKKRKEKSAIVLEELAMRGSPDDHTMQVKVETCAVEAEERAPAVVDAARRHGASLLVLGQRPRRHAVARWLQQVLWRRRRSRGSSSTAAAGGSMVEYCIEHAPCVALAVRRRSSGGYLVSSKHHRDFWLLA